MVRTMIHCLFIVFVDFLQHEIEHVLLVSARDSYLGQDFGDIRPAKQKKIIYSRFYDRRYIVLSSISQTHRGVDEFCVISMSMPVWWFRRSGLIDLSAAAWGSMPRLVVVT